MPLQVFAGFGAGDLVQLCRKETLMFKGEAFLPAPKGQVFTVFKQEPGKDLVYVAFIQKDGGVIAVTLPESALELVPPDPWILLQRASDSFREQRFDESRRLVGQAAQDPEYKALASTFQAPIDLVLAAAKPAAFAVKDIRAALSALEQKRKTAVGPEAEAQIKALVDTQNARLNLALKPFSDAMGKARVAAFELDRSGYASLALALDDGLDRLSVALAGKRAPDASPESGVPVSKLDKAEVLARVNKAGFSLVRCRQAMAVRRMLEASNYVSEGLAAEPGHAGLKALQAKVQENLTDADDRYKVASANRSGRNLAQGLLALERGLKICADHPKLMALRVEMSGAMEGSTSPAVIPAMLNGAKPGVTKDTLEEGRRIYTTRCSECHDLEMLDSRSITGWKNEVRKMAGKAHLKGNQEELIMEYLTAAQPFAGKS